MLIVANQGILPAAAGCNMLVMVLHDYLTRLLAYAQHIAGNRLAFDWLP